MSKLAKSPGRRNRPGDISPVSRRDFAATAILPPWLREPQDAGLHDVESSRAHQAGLVRDGERPAASPTRARGPSSPRTCGSRPRDVGSIFGASFRPTGSHTTSLPEESHHAMVRQSARPLASPPRCSRRRPRSADHRARSGLPRRDSPSAPSRSRRSGRRRVHLVPDRPGPHAVPDAHINGTRCQPGPAAFNSA